MKVLWLTNTPVGASEYLKIKYPAGGWMSSLERCIKEVEGVELAVSFFYNEIDEFKFDYNQVTYYPIKDKYSSIKRKINSRLFNKLYDTNVPALLKVIDDYKPDIIQLFGTESGLGEIISKTKVPVIVHIQGLINPYLSSWFPKGISQNTVLANSSPLDVVLKKRSHWLLLSVQAHG